MLVKNCHHHSKKERKGRGVSKGVIKARRQALKCLKAKLRG
jgi:hypothetical protein